MNSSVGTTRAQKIPQGGSSGIGRAFRDVLNEAKGWRGREPCFKEGCTWGEGFKNPPALAVPAEGQLGAHHRASFPAARGRVPDHIEEAGWYTTTPSWQEVPWIVSKDVLIWMSHFRGFYSILSSCTHWHVNPVY